MYKTVRNTTFRVVVGVLSAVLILAFNNCKGKTEGALVLDASSGSNSNSGLGSGATGTLCEQSIKNLYARSWHSFLNTNCSTCHANGPGKGRFANPDLNTAFEEFMAVGYVKVGNNAISTTHNPPYSGIQHTQIVNEMKLEWQRGLQDYATCTGDSSVVPQESQIEKITLRTVSKPIGSIVDGVPTAVTFDINSDLTRIQGTDALPTIPGGRFSIYVTKLKNAGGFSYYTFSTPKVHGNTVDVNFKGIFINLNGILLNYPTTFSYVDKSVRQGATNTGFGDVSGLISTGSLITPKVIVPSDVISVSFISIEQVTLPPPPPPTVLSIVGARTITVPGGTSFMDVTLQLTNPAAEPIVVTLSENNNLCGTAITLTNSNTTFRNVSTTCLPEVYAAVCPSGGCSNAVLSFGRSRSVTGATYNRYDWDYKFPVNSVTFSYGDQTKTLRVYFSQDIRREANRALTLEIASVLGPVNMGANTSVTFVVNKHNNPVPNPSVPTFTELMDPNFGILGSNCVKCHNSTDNAGGYDMTDHNLMLTRNVLIPGDVNSKMYIRMNPVSGNLAKPMPLDGFRPQVEVQEVENWILDGAKNN